jgi:hypothetical protein
MTPLQDTLRHGWLSLITGSMECAIRPQDAPTVRAAGPHPYRVLLLGGGVAAGLGVSRHDRALPGHLARHLASISGRGVDLDITARLGMTLTDARTEIDGRDLTGYDAIVLALGTADALAALPTLQWRERFERLLTALLSKSHPNTRILSLGTHPSPWAPYLHPYLTRRAARRLTDYNQICRELCWSLPRTSYLAPLDKPSAPTTQYAAGDYERIGRAVAAHLAHRLVGHPGSLTPPSPDRPPRHVSLAGLGLLDHSPHIAVERIVARTQAAFGVERAAITELRGTETSPLISGRRRDGGTSPDSDSPAAVAAKAGGLAITNVREDPRFQNSPWARRRGVTFYAAHPIYAPTGEAIGVLAIFDPQPRTFSRLEMGVLRDHAQLIQEVIARADRTPAQQTPVLGPPPVSDDTDQERQREIGRRASAGSQRSHTRAPSNVADAQWQ